MGSMVNEPLFIMNLGITVIFIGVAIGVYFIARFSGDSSKPVKHHK